MKNKKALTLTVFALSMVSLSGCGLQAAINTMALSAAMQLPYIVNNVDLETQSLAQFETMPTSLSTEAEIQYVQNVLAIPKSIAISQSGINVNVEFVIESEGIANFLVFEQNLNELAGEGGQLPEQLQDVELTAFVLVPVGLGDYSFNDDPATTESIAAFADHMQTDFDVVDVLKITEQPMVELSIDVTGKIGTSEKTKTFYFKINRTTLDDLAALADTTIEELGVPTEIAEYVAEWPSTPQPEVLTYVNENWPATMPPEMGGENWPEELPTEWQTTWPSAEEAEDWVETNWPENLSEFDWMVYAGLIGASTQP